MRKRGARQSIRRHTEGRNAMSCAYLVRYRGLPEDSASFLDHYRTRHAPILRDYPNIRACYLHVATPWVDPVAVRPDNLFLLADLRFDSVGDLNAALSSGKRQRSREDFVNFPRFDGEITHQAVVTERLF
jgi:uncharacterized protein (TIGR02118 family)